MRRTISLTIALAALIAVLYGWRAISDVPVVMAAAPAADPIERDRLISEFERRVSTADPEPLNLAVLGRLYLERGRSDSRLSDYTLARDTLLAAAEHLDDQATLLNLADSHLALHEFSAAREIAAQLTAEAPLDDVLGDQALATLADAEIALGEYPAALEALKRLAQRFPDEPSILARRAHYHFLTGDIDTALDLAERAAGVADWADLPRPDQAFYLMTAGRLNFEAGDYGKARSLLLQAIKADPRAPGPLFELGRVRGAEGDLSEAIRLLEAAVGLVPDPTSLAYLGDLYLASGDAMTGAAQYDTIEAVAELNQGAYRLSVAAALAFGGRDPDAALTLAREELEVRSDPTTWHVYAVSLYQTGAVDDAHAAMRNALGPADARLWYHAGVIAAAAGRPEEAALFLTAAFEANPEFHPIDAGRGRDLLTELAS